MSRDLIPTSTGSHADYFCRARPKEEKQSCLPFLVRSPQDGELLGLKWDMVRVRPIRGTADRGTRGT